MRTTHALAAIAALALAMPAAAQTPQAGAQAPAAGQARPAAQGRGATTTINGDVVSITDKEMTLKAADGKTTTFPLGPIYISKVVPASTIKSGDFVATTNITLDEKTGTATELRVFPPTLARGDQGESYPMGAADSTRIMTNAPVAKVVDTPEGRILTTRLASGAERRIILPSTVKVIGNSVVDKAMVKPGWHVRAILSTGADGNFTPLQILTGENGGPLPAR